MKSLRPILAFALFACAMSFAVAQEVYLDVTTLDPPAADVSDDPNPPGARRDIDFHTIPLSLPLESTILSIEPQAVENYGSVIAILRLRNRGTEPVAIPWAIDWRIVRQEQAISMSLALRTEAGGDRSKTTDPVILHGSPALLNRRLP